MKAARPSWINAANAGMVGTMGLRELVSCSRSAPALWVLLCVSCAPRGEEPPDEAVLAVVDGFEKALSVRDYEAAHERVDYRFRLAEGLGDIWEGGDEAAREDLVAATKAMMVETSERYRDKWVGRPMVRRLIAREHADVWIQSGPASDGGDGFAWRYRLARRGATWAITRRDFQVDGTPVDSTRFWPIALKQIATQFGRTPTLREFVANLPSVQGTAQMRRIRVPELGSRPATP